MRAKDDPFVFSVIMSVYQVKDYIDEAIGSLINQTIGFDKIQLVLVDDGSTDGSGEICDRYKEKYPGRVTVIHKENGGLSSARNTGLPYVKGKYVSFFDPDDILDSDTLEKVGRFMDDHYDEVDLCSIPLMMFGDLKGPHKLNNKFKDGTRVIDLLDENNVNYFQLSAASAFYKASVARTMCFDDRHSAEDAKENLRILINKPKLGVVSDTEYHYRKRGDSIVGRSQLQVNWYVPHLRYFIEPTLNMAEEQYGYIPLFVQYAVMYDLQWKIKQSKIPQDVLTPEEEQEYRELFSSIIRRIDDDVISHQKPLSMAQRLFVLGKKYGRLPELRMNEDQTDIEICYGEKTLIKVSDIKAGIEFAFVDRKKNNCILEGYHVIYGGIEKRELTPLLLVNGKIYPCEKIDRIKNTVYAMDEELTWRMGFRAEIPLQNGMTEIVPVLQVDQTMIRRKIQNIGRFFPISPEFIKYMHADLFGYRMKMNEGEIYLSPRPGWVRRTADEIRLLREILRKNYKGGGKKAVIGRLYYHLVKPIKRRQLWIVSDRIMKADDNGEALFKYLRKNKPPRTRVLFAISKNSEDASRLVKTGPCVDAMSLRHKLLHLVCDVNISAQADGVTLNPYSERFEPLRDLMAHQHYVFLQHGIIKDDLSDWLNRYNKDMSGFVTSALPEYQSVLEGEYYYSPDQIWLTGLPRFDYLYHHEEKKITLMPTWRKYLMQKADPKTGKRLPVPDFYERSFFQFYHGLLNSDRLLNTLDQYGYRMQFFPHPNIRLSEIDFETDPRVVILPTDIYYRDIYASSKLIITDYSSAVFDFAYLRKPVLYCQFDQDEFFAGEHVYTKGYFDYERDGFGEVTYDLESTIDRIIEYAANDCELKNEYRDRIDRFFAFNDQENCRRVTEKILQMQSER